MVMEHLLLRRTRPAANDFSHGPTDLAGRNVGFLCHEANGCKDASGKGFPLVGRKQDRLGRDFWVRHRNGGTNLAGCRSRRAAARPGHGRRQPAGGWRRRQRRLAHAASSLGRWPGVGRRGVDFRGCCGGHGWRSDAIVLLLAGAAAVISGMGPRDRHPGDAVHSVAHHHDRGGRSSPGLRWPLAADGGRCTLGVGGRSHTRRLGARGAVNALPRKLRRRH
jgi:hypothetical protein